MASLVFKALYDETFCIFRAEPGNAFQFLAVAFFLA